MSGQTLASVSDLSHKIARLVEERGWNQEEFARIAKLNRQTVGQIIQSNGMRRLRNATVGACAKALGLSVGELRHLKLEQLLPRIARRQANGEDTRLHRLYEEATQPELLSWLERNPDRARRITEEEMEDLLSLQGTGGPMTRFGVEHFIEISERKRRLDEKVGAIAGTEYLDLLERLVALIYEKVQPYPERS